MAIPEVIVRLLSFLNSRRGWDKTKKGPFNAEHDQYRILIPLMISVQDFAFRG